MKVVRTEIASAASTLEENTQHIVRAQDSLIETERQMRLLILRLVRLGESRDQLEKTLELASAQLENKECLLEELALEARRIKISIEQAKKDLDLLSSNTALCEKRKIEHLKLWSDDFHSAILEAGSKLRPSALY